jgi:hypothetical protein
MLTARLRLRGQRELDSQAAVKVQLSDVVRIATLARAMLEAPMIRVDSVGAYIFSDEPVCPR